MKLNNLTHHYLYSENSFFDFACVPVNDWSSYFEQLVISRRKN